jgi:hypothetical protein
MSRRPGATTSGAHWQGPEQGRAPRAPPPTASAQAPGPTEDGPLAVSSHSALLRTPSHGTASFRGGVLSFNLKLKLAGPVQDLRLSRHGGSSAAAAAAASRLRSAGPCRWPIKVRPPGSWRCAALGQQYLGLAWPARSSKRRARQRLTQRKTLAARASPARRLATLRVGSHGTLGWAGPAPCGLSRRPAAAARAATGLCQTGCPG